MLSKQFAMLLVSTLGVASVTAMPADVSGSSSSESSSSYYPPSNSSEGSPALCDGRKWKYIGRELKSHFINHYGECTSFARQSIRLPFHDCFPDGGCDGSIILSNECTTREENQQMIPMCGVLGKMAQQYGVGVADLINFAAAVANVACPYGPYIPFLTGRRDSSTAAPTGQIPPPVFDSVQMIAAFGARGFTPTDLVALVGAHSAGKNLSGAPFDTTPGKLDSHTYYRGVLTGDADAILFSDHSLATAPNTYSDWLLFAHSQGAWDGAYVSAMWKMITQGNDPGSLHDCSRIVHELFL